MRYSPVHLAQSARWPSRRLVPCCLVPHGASNWLTWELPPGFLKSHPWIARNQRHACLVVAEWRDVSLGLLAPMNLHAFGPCFHSIMPSLREPDFLPRIRVQAAPTPHAGMDAIGSDNPPRFQYRIAKDGAIIGQAGDGCVP